MDCYFGSHHLPPERDIDDKTVVVSFLIPEVGIRFKAPFAAVDPDHADLAALLALLEFIDGNQKYFPNRTYRIYGRNRRIINGLNEIEPLPGKFANLKKKAQAYRAKYRFSLEWRSSGDNADLESLFD